MLISGGSARLFCIMSPILRIPLGGFISSILQESYVPCGGIIPSGTFLMKLLCSVLYSTVPLRMVTISGMKGFMRLEMTND